LTAWKPARETEVPWAMMLLVFVVTYEALRWCGKWLYLKVRSGMRADAADARSVPLLSTEVYYPEVEPVYPEVVEPLPEASSSSQAQWEAVPNTVALRAAADARITCDHDEVMTTKYGKKFHVYKCHGMCVADPTTITKITQCSQCMPDRAQAEIYVSTDGSYHTMGCEFGRSYGNEPRRMELCKHCQASGRA
jgi:hypothetical protein